MDFFWADVDTRPEVSALKFRIACREGDKYSIDASTEGTLVPGYYKGTALEILMQWFVDAEKMGEISRDQIVLLKRPPTNHVASEFYQESGFYVVFTDEDKEEEEANTKRTWVYLFDQLHFSALTDQNRLVFVRKGDNAATVFKVNVATVNLPGVRRVRADALTLVLSISRRDAGQEQEQHSRD